MIREQIYAAYPRKVGRGLALAEIDKALARIPLEAPHLRERSNLEIAELLLNTVIVYAASPAGQRKSFTPHPSTWFHQSRYLDDPKEWFYDDSKQDDLARRNSVALSSVFGGVPDPNRTPVLTIADTGRGAGVERLPRQLLLGGD